MKPMDCTDIKALLSALIDDCVESDTRHLAERHLADCESCRTLIDEAEAAEAMVAASVDDLAPLDMLPDGFKANVLARTVYADEKTYHPNRWTTWLGWVAAAASLALALTLWVVDNSGNLPGPGTNVAIRNIPSASTKDASHLGNEAAQGPSNTYAVDDSRTSFAELNRISMMPTSLRHTSKVSNPTSQLASLTLDEIDTLDQTAQLLMMLAQAPQQSLTEIERIRRIAEYDELLPKLSRLRAKLAQKDRSNTYAAELLLQRIIHSQLGIHDVQEMRSAINELNLPSIIDEMATFARRATTL